MAFQLGCKSHVTNHFSGSINKFKGTPDSNFRFERHYPPVHMMLPQIFSSSFESEREIQRQRLKFRRRNVTPYKNSRNRVSLNESRAKTVMFPADLRIHLKYALHT